MPYALSAVLVPIHVVEICGNLREHEAREHEAREHDCAAQKNRNFSLKNAQKIDSAKNFTLTLPHIRFF